jgi:hypothetical protein
LSRDHNRKHAILVSEIIAFLLRLQNLLLWHVGSLLSDFTTTVTRKRSVNSNREMFSVLSVPRCYKLDQLAVVVIMKMQMFATLDKANRDTGNIRGLTLAAVKHATVQVTRLLL